MNTKREMTIGKKLFASFGAALALTLVISAASMLSITTLDRVIGRLVNVSARELFLAGEINAVMSDFISEERGIIVRGFMKDKATVIKYDQEFRDSMARMRSLLGEFEPLAENAEIRRTLSEIERNTATIARHHDDLYRLVNEEKMDEAAGLLRSTVMPLAVQSGEMAKRLAMRQEELMKAAGNEAAASVLHSRWITLVMIALSLLAGFAVVAIIRHINSRLRQTVAELTEGSEQTASAASQVSASSQSLAQGASEQAASLEETSASTEEINSMARQNSGNSEEAARVVTASGEKFAEATRLLEQMVAAMAEIKSSSDGVARIIKTIEEIAFQTNILALNAAVEAARAGEAGAGFAVVADEVRNLAQRSALAAKDTTALIEEAITKAGEGQARVDTVAAAIRAVAEDTAKVKTLVDEVHLGSGEQTRGLEQIGKAISQMEQVTQRTAAGAEECASAAEELNAQSETVRGVVLRLSAMVGAGAGAVHGRTAATAARNVGPKEDFRAF